MRFIKKKKLSIFVLLAIMFQAVIAPMAFAETTPVDKPSLVALGDSITFGWNLYEGENPDKTKPSAHAFPNYILGGGFEVTNLSWPGWTSGDLLGAIKTNPSYVPSIANADVITLNIGNNDLLQAVDLNNLLTEGPLTDEKIEELKGKITAASLQMGANLTEIMGIIRHQNKVAPIIFYNIYNPFGQHVEQHVPKLHTFGEEIVTAVNQSVIAPISARVPGTILVDAYSAYNGKQHMYVRQYPDVHPTIEGQKVLASLADKALASLLPPELEIALAATPTEEVEGPITVNIETNHEEILEMKWLPGELAVEDFGSEGNDISLDKRSFEVTENGFYTVYVLSGTGEEKVKSIEITNILPKVEEPPVEKPPVEEPPVEEPPVEEPPAEEPPVKEDPKGEQPTKEEPTKEEPVKDENKVTPDKKETKSGPKLPKTASPLYNMLAVGITTLLIGSAVLAMYLRRNRTA
ncbi:SGNH/GDSL hydrolase family protein [Ferdinandcohnia sp. Marseille-Q9671]